MRKVVIHNYFPQQDSLDAELNYSRVMKGWMFRANGKTYGPFDDKAKAEAELEKAKGSTN